MLAESLSARPERFEKVSRGWLEKSGERREVELEEAWWHEDRLILKFRGMDSISDADPWRDAELVIDAAGRIDLDEGEYFHSDLIGCEVADKSGRLIGVVEAVSETGAVDLLVVRPDADGKKEILIPFTRAICEVDLVRRQIRVDPPEGLLEL
jgi:16S rRNA processing protein RimM